MPCCGGDTSAIGGFFSRFAPLLSWRYRHFGLDASQHKLIAGIGQEGLDGTSILEIGCGVGFLHQTLLRYGAEKAVGVELSERMLYEAHALAEAEGLSERTHYRLGDFVELAPRLETADIVILDKVVCCYPDAKTLIETSLDKCAGVYALTYPRERLVVRLYVGAYNLFFWLIRARIRNYVHDPKAIEAWITEAGLEKVFEDQTLLWLTQVYARPLEAA
ncbi:MAG: class I SAM-dependent methyltransferase [Gammaproteobacteria bacterium]|nr:class I SAM-dependent methyltransferase [Gammaproteobacteria bacterium]